ncbi:hypothetical protein Tco_1340393 [Tanacetum coccineum]
MKTLKKQEQSTSIVDPLAYLTQTTHYHAPTQTTTPPPSQYGPLTSSTPQQVPQSNNDAMLATMNQIVKLLSGFQKQFPLTNNQLRTSSNSRSHATVHDGQIITETVQRRAPGNVGNTGNRGTQSYGQMTDNKGKKVICYNCHGEGHVARQYKEKKRVKDSQYFKDKMLLMEAKEKGTVLDAEAEAFYNPTLFKVNPTLVMNSKEAQSGLRDKIDFCLALTQQAQAMKTPRLYKERKTQEEGSSE